MSNIIKKHSKDEFIVSKFDNKQVHTSLKTFLFKDMLGRDLCFGDKVLYVDTVGNLYSTYFLGTSSTQLTPYVFINSEQKSYILSTLHGTLLKYDWDTLFPNTICENTFEEKFKTLYSFLFHSDMIDFNNYKDLYE